MGVVLDDGMVDYNIRYWVLLARWVHYWLTVSLMMSLDMVKVLDDSKDI